MTAARPQDVGPPPVCSRTFAPDAALRAALDGTPIRIATFFAEKPSSGRFSVEGYVQAPHHCPPCPPGLLCKPCEEYVFLSETKAAYEHPISDGVDLRVAVPDATRFELLGRYRMTVEVCSNGERELRGYREAPL